MSVQLYNSPVYDQLLNATDYQLEISEYEKFFDLDAIEEIRNDAKLRKKVVLLVQKLLLFFGYKISSRADNVVQVSELRRKDNGIIVGLLSSKHYPKIRQILVFLNAIGLQRLSQLFFLAMCRAVKKDDLLKSRASNAFETWIDTQEYIRRTKSKHTAFEKTCSSLQGLDYTGNSCYQDSTLLALLAIPNPVIQTWILDRDVSELKTGVCSKDREQDLRLRYLIQQELKRITASMIGLDTVRYCSDLRKLFAGCSERKSEGFHGKEPRDAGEFLQFLFDIFEVDNLKQIVTTYGKNPDQKMIMTSKRTEIVSPIVSIFPNFSRSLNFSGSNPREINLENSLTKIDIENLDQKNLFRTDNQTFSTRIQTTKIVDPNYLVFYIHQTSIPRTSFRVIAPERIKNLSLHAIVVHLSGHYTCFIKCPSADASHSSTVGPRSHSIDELHSRSAHVSVPSTWFYYDDNPGSSRHQITPVGSYKNLSQHWMNPEKHGKLYFYS